MILDPFEGKCGKFRVGDEKRRVHCMGKIIPSQSFGRTLILGG